MGEFSLNKVGVFEHPSAKRHVLGAGVLALALLTAALVLLFRPYRLPIDDAYITLHNADALWAGGDRNYGGSALTGATSLVHLALVALLTPRMGQLAAIAISYLAGVLYLAGVAALAERQKLDTRAHALLLLIAVGTGSVLFHLLNGMETALVVAVVTWAIVLAADNKPRLELAALCGLMPFVHPELGALSIALMGRQAWRRRELGGIAADLALACAAAAPWITWSILATGSPLPATAGAKAAFFVQGATDWQANARLAAEGIFGGLGALVLTLLLVKRSSLAVALWAFVSVFFLAFAVAFPIGLSHNWHRYTYALLPVCLWAMSDLWANRRRMFWVFGLLFGLIAPIMVWQGAAKVAAAQGAMADAFNTADWAGANLPASAPVLVHDAGVIAYATRLHLVDVVGLKTPAARIKHQRLTLPTRGAARGRAVAEIARDARVRYAIVADDGGNWSMIGRSLAEAGWALAPMRVPRVKGGYVIYGLTPPN
jgi:hypothetical protein